MNYIYHITPEQMKGETLYPLNELRDKYPEVFDFEVKKYGGREGLMKKRIPVLDCLWNDALHFAAVDPRDIVEALRESGIDPARYSRWFKIPADRLDESKAVVWLNRYGRNDSRFFSEDDFVEYRAEDVASYGKLSEKTKKYYRDMGRSGKKFLLFRFIPHILYKGSVDVSNLEIVSFS